MEPRGEEDADRAIGRLLSGRARLSRPEHESIAARVLEATAAEVVPASTSRSKWLWPTGLLLAAAAAVLLVVALPDGADPVDPDPDPFTARGGSEGPQLQLDCDPDCTPGSQVVLEASDIGAYSHVAVFSFRDDGVAIWYAPGDKGGTSVPLAPGTRTLLPFRIELDEAHSQGRYDVVAVFSQTPLDRDALRAAYQERPDTVAIVERVLVVEAPR